MRTVVPAVMTAFFALSPAADVLAQDTAAQPVYTYDDQGHVKTATYPNGAQISYAYDANGNLQAVTQIVAPSDDAQTVDSGQ